MPAKANNETVSQSTWLFAYVRCAHNTKYLIGLEKRRKKANAEKRINSFDSKIFKLYCEIV